MKRIGMLAVMVAMGLNAGSASEPVIFGTFCGSTPCGKAIRPILHIQTNGEPELIEWKLTLYRDAKTAAPSRYELHCKYGWTAPNVPGLAKDIKKLERQGTRTVSKGTKSNPQAIVFELSDGPSFFQVTADILQVLNPDRSLMIGTAGWSYTLNRTEHAEKAAEQAPASSQPATSYKISELATGPTVFGVFEGRTPCKGIARAMNIPLHAGSIKAKWRVTLYQNPETRAQTTYKLEGSLFRSEPREGNWTIVRGTDKDPNAPVYHLAGKEADSALFLLKGDDNVLFFLDQNRDPLVGNCDFSYTLNRR